MSGEVVFDTAQRATAVVSRERSVSLPLFTEKTNRLESSSTLHEDGARPTRAQSSDSLFSLDKSSYLNLDSSSQISLPDLNNTVVDSEGYASFRSNPSSTSSPWTSSHNSPTGESDRFENSLDSEAEENSCNGEGVLQNSEACTNILSFVMTSGNGGRSHQGAVGGIRSASNVYISSAEDDLLLKERVLQDPVSFGEEKTKPLSLDFAKRMSTIVEVHEGTPSPRTINEFDKAFSSVYKNISDTRKAVSFNKHGTGSDQNEFKVEENDIKGIAEEQTRMQFFTAQSCSHEGNVQDGSENIKKSLVYNERDTTEKSKSQLSEECSTKNQGSEGELGNRGLATDFGNEAPELGEQAFDIDLDLYDIPKEKRLPLEAKLKELRTFVERIIDDRKSLEQDRLSLQRIMNLIRSKESTAWQEITIEPAEMSDSVDLDSKGEQEGAYRDLIRNFTCGEFCNGRCLEASSGDNDPCIREGPNAGTVVGKDFGLKSENQALASLQDNAFDCEELLSNLEEALMENIGLKNENEDLSSINNELRKQIEDLLTQEEELRYKINTTTMRLMEDVGRQREENVVLRSNFNKVLRDYNELEIELEELKENYEELICERDLLVDELAIKNEDYTVCRKECEQLVEELDEVKGQLEQCDMAQEKIWTRQDWENWTLLQTKVAATENALLGARKQKAQLIADLKGMRKRLEVEGQRIQQAEAAMNSLELHLKQACEKNNSLKRENDELRWSILMYEARFADLARSAGEQSESEAEHTDLPKADVLFNNSDVGTEQHISDRELKKHKEETMVVKQDAVSSQMCQESETVTENSVVLRKESKSHGFRRARTFPINEMESLAARFCQDAPADFYAGSHYQNAFQEIGSFQEEGDDDDDDEPLTIKVSKRPNESRLDKDRLCNADLIPDKSISEYASSEDLNRKMPQRYTCLPLRLVFPALMQSLLHSKSKRGKRSVPTD